MPVQSSTTAAIAWLSTVGKISGRLALQLRQLVLRLFQLREQRRPLRLVGGCLRLLRGRRRRRGRLAVLGRGRVGAGHRGPVDGVAVAAQRARASPGSCRPAPSPTSSASPARRAAWSRASSFSFTSFSRSVGIPARRLLAADDRELGLERLDAAAAVLHLGRHRVLADGDARARGVEQAHRLVRQLARGNVAVRQLDRRLERLVEQLHAVVRLQRRGHAAHHQQRLVLGRLRHLHHLEAARERRILLDVLLVLGPGGGGDGAQLAARQRRLQQVGRVAGAGRAARADQRVRLVDEQDDRLGRRLHLVDDLAQAVLELALHARARLQQAHVERAQRHVLEHRRHVAAARCAARSPRRPRSCRRPPRR